MNRAATLAQLVELCRNHRNDAIPQTTQASGTSALDAVLPGGGWQSGTIVELMPTQTGIGELRLLMPTIASITQRNSHVALISPPFVPYAPALARAGVALERLLIVDAQQPQDILWSLEQTLRCGSFDAVVGWPAKSNDRDVRRLQLAAEAGRSIGFIYRAPAAALDASPAAVRLKLQRENGELRIDVIKCRGARADAVVRIFHGEEHEASTAKASRGQPLTADR